jgi:hypothetical protein
LFGFHIKAFFRAQFNTGLAIDTSKMVYRKDFFFEGHKDGFRRAASHANAAVNTYRQFNHDLAARIFIGRALDERITPRGGFGPE